MPLVKTRHRRVEGGNAYASPVSHRDRSQRAALAALAITAGLAAAKLAVWAATSSLAILSQALDSTLDIVSLGLVFLAVRISYKPADSEHQYGHAKAENLVAFTQTLILVAVVVLVVREAIGRLGETGRASTPGYAFAVLGVSALADVVRVRLLLSAANENDSDSLRAGALNFIVDIGTAAVAGISLLLQRTGIEDADAIGGIIIGIAVLAAAWRVGKRSVDVLMDRAPAAQSHAIEVAAARAPGVAEARRVRVRESGGRLFADVTVAAGRTSSLERAHDIAEEVEREIERVAPGSDVVVHVEPISETGELVERVQAAASRVDGVHEVHNVSVHAFGTSDDQQLRVTLHAKANPGTSLIEAHALSDAVEEAVARELGGTARVDSHIEPLEPTSSGRDVTALRPDVVDAVRRLSLQEDDVVDCHEVLVTDAGGQLAVVAHVRGRGDLALSRIHDASQRIEKELHAAHPEVGPVLIHFEPAQPVSET
jgi:cation diffusion facilitator family transporter